MRDDNWRKDESIRNNIVANMRTAEEESYKILQYIDDMIDERHAM